MAEKTEDLNLPLSVISRIIKESLPDGVLVSKEARTAVARAASVFVLHATTHANQSALNAKRKTITAQDVIEGVVELDMDDFVEPLKSALDQWKSQQDAKSAAKKAAKDSSKTSKSNEEESQDLNGSGVGESEDGSNEGKEAEPMEQDGSKAVNSADDSARASEDEQSENGEAAESGGQNSSDAEG